MAENHSKKLDIRGVEAHIARIEKGRGINPHQMRPGGRGGEVVSTQLVKEPEALEKESEVTGSDEGPRSEAQDIQVIVTNPAKQAKAEESKNETSLKFHKCEMSGKSTDRNEEIEKVENTNSMFEVEADFVIEKYDEKYSMPDEDDNLLLLELDKRMRVLKCESNQKQYVPNSCRRLKMKFA